MSAKTAELAKESKKFGGPSEPITLNIANRLFAQKGYHFRETFLSLVKQNFGGALSRSISLLIPLRPRSASTNGWQTRLAIEFAISRRRAGQDNPTCPGERALLKAPWASEFSQNATQPQPFFVRGVPVDVPMMRKTDKNFGYAKHEGFTVEGLPYAGNELQFLVLLPTK